MSTYPKQVQCIDTSGPYTTQHLTLWQVYTAIGEIPGLGQYILDGVSLNWDMRRFEEVIPATWATLNKGQRVQCIIQGARFSHTGIVFYVSTTNGIVIHWDDGQSLLSGWTQPGSFIIVSDTTTPTSSVPIATLDPTVAINDHVCPSCKNDRCSRSEKICWKCGSQL